jgi:hypothetical protein
MIRWVRWNALKGARILATGQAAALQALALPVIRPVLIRTQGQEHRVGSQGDRARDQQVQEMSTCFDKLPTTDLTVNTHFAHRIYTRPVVAELRTSFCLYC